MQKRVYVPITAIIILISAIIKISSLGVYFSEYMPIIYSDIEDIYSNDTVVVQKGNPEAEADTLTLYSMYCCLIDARSGRVLYGKKEDTKAAMASTTKIMTLQLVLEHAELDEYLTISKNAASQPKVRLGVKPGEKYKVRDMLYALMLESYNDAAVALAEHVAGSTDAFCEMMTSKACSIGCGNTLFLTPNGLDMANPKNAEEYHSTTAYELAKILSYCICESEHAADFLKITQTKSYSFSESGSNRSFTVNNKNAFLSMMEGALTGKTGFTGKAGYCYTGALESNNRIFTVALLACGWPNNKSYKWSDTRKLMQYGMENYNSFSFDEIPIDTYIENDVKVINAKGTGFNTAADIPVEISDCSLEQILISQSDTIKMYYNIPKQIKAPVYTGDMIGEIIYSINGKEWSRREITAAKSVEATDFQWVAQKILALYLGGV